MCMIEHMCVCVYIYIFKTRIKTVTNEIETKLKVNLGLKHSWAMSLNFIIFVLRINYFTAMSVLLFITMHMENWHSE